MKKTFFLVLLTIGIISCEKDNVEDSVTQENTDLVENSLSKNSNSPIIYTDASGRVEVSVTGKLIQERSNLESLTVYVPEGFVCIGGSTHASVQPGDPGALLTMSAPTVGADEFRGWRAEAKAHLYGNGVWWFEVVAIGIRLKDNDGNYIPEEELKNSLQLFSNTSAVASHPSTSASVPFGFKLISGGAKVNWSGAGNLLTASYPSGNSWVAKGKDHVAPSAASITSYAIGIKNNIPNFGSLNVLMGDNCEDASGGFAESLIRTPPGYATVSGGAKSTFNSWGRLLTSITVDRPGAHTRSKDHGYGDSGTVCSYYIAVKKD
ncbi:hypothetical protein [Aquimarina mytili]|uniref:Uncharacterized protein n=1 Tax=Aquimarina mytili TaxID=874423 RepID=A0A937A3N2_9FLAO|nr:hypothetical protein [Aquimarina mytili]MBL0683779.1 hypothetical protein [Aquimarina mytili]